MRLHMHHALYALTHAMPNDVGIVVSLLGVGIIVHSGLIMNLTTKRMFFGDLILTLCYLNWKLPQK